MKRVILVTILTIGLTAGYGFAQMGQGHMMGQGMMGSQNPEQTCEAPYGYGGGYYPCQMMGGYGMGPGMMGGMMGPGMMGHMGGYGMGPGMMGGMMGSGMMGYGYGGRGSSPEDYQKYQEKYQKYLDDTSGLRRKLHNLKFEYMEAVRNPDSDRQQIMKLEKEIRDIQWEIYEKAPR